MILIRQCEGCSKEVFIPLTEAELEKLQGSKFYWTCPECGQEHTILIGKKQS